MEEQTPNPQPEPVPSTPPNESGVVELGPWLTRFQTICDHDGILLRIKQTMSKYEVIWGQRRQAREDLIQVLRSEIGQMRKEIAQLNNKIYSRLHRIKNYDPKKLRPVQLNILERKFNERKKELKARLSRAAALQRRHQIQSALGMRYDNYLHKPPAIIRKSETNENKENSQQTSQTDQAAS